MAVPSVAGFKAGGGAHHSASSPFLIFIILVVLLFLALLPLDDAVDCDDFESDDDLVVVPCERNGPSWKHLRWQVVLGLGIWACWIAGSELGQRKWEEVCARNPDGALPPLFRAYVGTAVRLRRSCCRTPSAGAARRQRLSRLAWVAGLHPPPAVAEPLRGSALRARLPRPPRARPCP